MSHATTIGRTPATPTVQQSSQATRDNEVISDLRFMEAWETNRLMHPGIMLRARQIRRANPHRLATGLRCKSTMQGAGCQAIE